MRRIVVFCAWYLTGICVVDCAWAADEKPNIIVIFTDDMGWPDVSCQDLMGDVKTPHVDNLAARGVRFTDGYVTAPQCTPSRAGLLTGRYQQRYDFDNNLMNPLPKGETLFAERLQQAGYTTGMVGKWHLEPNGVSYRWAKQEGHDLPRQENGHLIIPHWAAEPYFANHRGFGDVFQGQTQAYWANYGLNGGDFAAPQHLHQEGYRLDLQTDAAVQFIRRHHDEPFHLYLSYFAPHVPLEATPRYLARFPGKMPERRRYALAMISAIDDGVGRIVSELDRFGIEENTLIIFLSDNGAPIKIHKEDITLDFRGGAWDGSVNDPLNGEKGMLLEGGIRVPFIVCWPGALSAGKVLNTPVISLDIAATALAAAGLEQPEYLDGVNLLPHLMNHVPAPDRPLFWRFKSQAAVRLGDWKLFVISSGHRYLFNLAKDKEERHNVLAENPTVAKELGGLLTDWCSQLTPAGLPTDPIDNEEKGWYLAYLGLQTDD